MYVCELWITALFPHISVADVHYLKEDLDGSVDYAHPPAHNGKEWCNELDEVVGQSFKAVEPPRRAMKVVGHWVWNWLGLERGIWLDTAQQEKSQTLDFTEQIC